MPKAKKFVVDGREYQVTVGGSNVKISLPGIRTLAPSVNEVAGVSNNEDFDDGYQCLPSNVASWIRRNYWRFTMSKGEQVLRLREPLTDDLLEYKANHGCDSICGLKIWGIKSAPQALIPHRWVVVMTELPDNHGVSVTNAVETIALAVMETYLRRMDPETITWIEHYPPRGDRFSLRLPESYDRVHLRFDGNRFRLDTTGCNGWSRLTEQDLTNLGIL